MSILIWTPIGMALWHFTVSFPDKFVGGIIGALLVALGGALFTGYMLPDPGAPLENPPGIEQAPAIAELPHRAAARAPLVEIAHQHRGAVALAAPVMAEDRLDLVAPPKAGKVEVRPEHAHMAAVAVQVGAHRPARFERGQVERFGLEHLELAPHEQRIAVPAEAARPPGESDRLPRSVVERGVREHACTLADPPVHLLQGDHVGVDLAQHRNDPVGIAPPVDPDGLVYVVAGEGQPHRKGNAAQSGIVPGAPAI